MFMFAQGTNLQGDFTSTKEHPLSISLFKALNPEQVQILLNIMHIRHCRQSDHIFKAGDLPLNAYIVLNGRIDFVIKTDDVNCIQNSFTTGNIFGEAALLGQQRQIGTAIAATNDVELLILSRKALQKIRTQDLTFFKKLVVNLTRELIGKTALH